MLDIIKSIIIGIIEGITEFLPVSSTGHIILAESVMHIPSGRVWTKSFTDMFSYVIQLGAILAVIQLYFHQLNPLSKLKTVREQDRTWRLWIKVFVAVLPAVVAGLLLNDYMDEHFMNPMVVATTLIFYGIIFIIVENWNKTRTPKVTNVNRLTYKTAFLIGLFQVLAIVPGTSRSGSTIIGGLILGASREVAAEFSFFLAIPVMFGVTILKVGKYFLTGHGFSAMELSVLTVGFVVSWIVAWAAIKFMMSYIKKNDFKAFGWYRIALGIVVIFAGFFGLI